MRPAAVSAFARVVNCPAPTAVSTMSAFALGATPLVVAYDIPSAFAADVPMARTTAVRAEARILNLLMLYLLGERRLLRICPANRTRNRTRGLQNRLTGGWGLRRF